MAKFKPVRKKKPTHPRANAIGCVIVLAMGFLLLFLIMYYTVAQK